MELYVDGLRADTDSCAAVSVALSVAAVTDPRKGRTGYTRSIRVPMTPLNDSIFGYAAEINGAGMFNSLEHTGRIEHDGSVLIEGPLYLNSAERNAAEGYYNVHIIGAAKTWASRAAAKALRNTAVDFSKKITAAGILQSWTEDTPVRFLPVLRGTTGPDHLSGSVISTVKILSSDDYHPFIHAATLLRAIFAESGYRVESDFVDGEMFSSLYISGNYPTRDVSTLKANLDFLARRFSDGAAIANSLGRVYADPYRSSYTIGNLVDTADPEEVSAAGRSYDDVFTNNGCFGKDGLRIVFKPLGTTSVGFQYHIVYTTGYAMKNSARLKGFDTVYLDEDSPREFILPNPFPDRRDEIAPTPKAYKLAIFDFVEGYSYQLKYFYRISAQTTAEGTIATVTQRFSSVNVASVLPDGSTGRLYYRTSAADSWKTYTGDWAMYDGFVTESGTVDVELTLRTAPQTISPSSPKFFDSIWFGGADPGMQITVSEQSWIKPVFYGQPVEGATVGFADVAMLDATQMDFINALRQMFNLCFHTDNRSRTVRIEPRTAFFVGNGIVDWTGRIDLSKPIAVEEMGGDLSQEMAWCYRSGDGAVTRYNVSNGQVMGYWSAEIENKSTAKNTSVWENPMFTCSLNAVGEYAQAASASLVQAGDIDGEALYRTENLNFTPKIVRYEGMKDLPAGELWGWPWGGASYPKLAFHDPEGGFTLCFEDRDGCPGLHSYFDRDVRVWNNSRRVALHLRLDPADVESISFPSGFGPDFRKLFRLDIDGEAALYTLEEICGYDPSAVSTKCIFVKHIP